MIIKFIEIGRNKRTWESKCPVNHIDDLEYDWLFSQVKRNGGILSSEVDFLLDTETNTTGIITAGFHTVGKFEIRKDDPQ